MQRSIFHAENALNGVAGAIRFTPLQLYTTMTISKIGCTVTVFAGNVRFGIYADNGDVPDGGALLSETASVAPAANAKFEIALPANLQLIGGLYWLAVQASNAALALRTNGATGPNGTLSDHTVLSAYGAFPDPAPVTTIPLGGLPTLYVMVASIP